MITLNDVKYYHSIGVDFHDKTKNGGSIDENNEITSGDINNVFNETTATERENGYVKRAKIYVKNLTEDRIMSSTYLGITKDADYPDTLILYKATRKNHYGFTFDEDVKSGTAAGTPIAYTDPTPDGVNAAEFKGRVFQTGSQDLTVDEVDTDNKKLKFKEDTSDDISKGDLAHTVDDDEIYESDEDFDHSQKHINAIIVQTLNDGDDHCYIGTDDASNCVVGEPILIVDNYRRPIFRGKIKSITAGTDDSNKDIIFEKKYDGITIPSNTGYLATCLEFDVDPKKTKPFWLELDIGASNALSSETTSSFQLGVTFDDITAG